MIYHVIFTIIFVPILILGGLPIMMSWIGDKIAEGSVNKPLVTLTIALLVIMCIGLLGIR